MNNEPCSFPQGGDAPTGCYLLHLYLISTIASTTDQRRREGARDETDQD